MAEPGSPNRPDRRPANVPANWLTRQAVEIELTQRAQATGLGRRLTHTKLMEYIGVLSKILPGEYIDQGKGRAAHLSPNFREAIWALHTGVELAENVPGYLNRTQAEEYIGCPNSRFFDLVKDNPPDSKAEDVKILRNRNNQDFPHYSMQYCERLREAFLAQPTEPRDVATRQAPENGTHGPAVHRPLDIALAQEHNVAVAEDLRPLDGPQRRAAQVRIRQLLKGLDSKRRRIISDTRFNETIHQLGMASDLLARNEPMPSGLEALFARAQSYIDQDTDE